jgi:hypothetical protein
VEAQKIIDSVPPEAALEVCGERRLTQRIPRRTEWRQLRSRLLTDAIASDPALWAWQLGAIKPELFTGPMHDARVKDLVRSAKGNLRFSAVSMDRHHDVALVPLLMPMIEPAILLEQPFPKCRAFHCFAPCR